MISSKLINLGFETIIETNLSRDAMKKSLMAFIEKAKKANVAVFFYSGHALYIGSEYYLVPVNPGLKTNQIYSNDYYAARDIEDALSDSECKLSILFYDACRDVIRSNSDTKGYPTVIPDDIIGSIDSNSKQNDECIICYATEYKEKASFDEKASLSYFTQALSKHLTDTTEIRTVWEDIKKEMKRNSRHKQTPDAKFNYSNIFYFNPKGRYTPFWIIDKPAPRKKPWFINIDKKNKAAHLIGYSFSPEYPCGLDYMYRFKQSRFSLGLSLAMSPTLFKGISSYSDAPISTSVDGVIEINGKLTQYTQTTTTSVPSEYSKAIDLYNVAKFYNSNLLVLLNSGFNICNGVMIEAGVGATSNQQKIKMPYYITYQKIVKTNKITGERIGIQEAKTIQNDVVKWYKGNTKWSPATRIGLRTFIPIKSNRFSISLGGGYTFVITNFDYSSWDANIGICFTK